jgi:Tfp pilus assembly protein PilF
MATRMKRLPVPMVLTAVSLLLLHCAGGPPSRQQARWEELRDQGQALIERSTPEALAEAAGLSDTKEVPKRFRAEAARLASLAARLYRLLYPELAAQGRAPSAPEYTGPYAALLDSAERGLPPTAEAAASLRTDGEEGLLPRVLPYLYLHLRQARGGLPEAAAAQARQALEQASAGFPRSALPAYLLGLFLQLQGEPAQAAARFQASLGIADSFYPARVRLAAVELSLGRPAEAATSLTRVLSVLPESLDLRRQLVEAQLESGAGDPALAGSAQLLLREPDNPEFLLLRSHALLAGGQWSQALKPLGLLLAAHPDSGEALLLQARILFDHARQEEPALQTLAAAAKRFPDDPRFTELAGRILLDSDRESEGLRELGRALQMEPERASSLRILLAYWAGKKRWLAAAAYAPRLLAQQPTREDLLLASRVYQGLGDAAELRATAGRLYALDPAPPNAALYAAALAGDGMNEEALRLAEQALPGADSESRSRLLGAKAQALATRDPEQAVALLQQALDADPDNLQALRLLAELYAARLEYRKARQYLRQAVHLAPQDAGLRLRLEEAEREVGQSAENSIE